MIRRSDLKRSNFSNTRSVVCKVPQQRRGYDAVNRVHIVKLPGQIPALLLPCQHQPRIVGLMLLDVEMEEALRMANEDELLRRHFECLVEVLR